MPAEVPETCFWAGDAALKVRLTDGEEEGAVSVHTHGGSKYPRSAAAFGCTVHLEDFTPYPSSKTEIATQSARFADEMQPRSRYHPFG